MGFVGLLLAGGILSKAGITTSKHNFNNLGWANVENNEICLPCHTAHNKISQTPPVKLLWNHNTENTPYTFYTSLSMKAPTPTAMSGISKVCMGCHDGTVAVDAYGGSAGGDIQKIPDRYILGPNLGNDHPISIPYNNAVQRIGSGHMFDPAAQSSGLGDTIAKDMLYDGKLECSSCHDVHNVFSIPGLLKKSNDGSELCLTCHNLR